MAALRQFASVLDDRARRAAAAHAARAELARRHFSEFVKQCWRVVEGSKPLEWTPYHQGLCEELQALAEGWFAARGVASPRQLERVVAQWERHGLGFEEGEVLVQNEAFNLVPGMFKSTIVM